MSLGNWTERLVVGYFVLDISDDIFLTAASFAARQAPGVIAAPVAGVIVDRWPRARILGFTALYKVAIVATLALIASADDPALWPIFVVVSLGGIGQSFEIPSTQGLITDSVPRRLRMNAVSVQSIGARAVGAVGGLAGGLVIDSYGVPAAFSIGAAAFVLAAAATPLIQRVVRDTTGDTDVKFGVDLFTRSFHDLRALLRLPAVRALLIAALLVEMFGFAFGSVMPAMARDVLKQEASGLGALQMMAGFGGLVGVITLAALGDFRRKGLLLAGITVLYGVSLISFASSSIFPLSMVLVTGVGMMAGAFDAMQWTLLQESVPERMRGRAIGGWVFAIGFGWVGHLGLGALGETVGVQWALGGAGLLVLATGLVILRTGRRERPSADSPAVA
jgi:predicted MFS family arabinose efflux permease